KNRSSGSEHAARHDADFAHAGTSPIQGHELRSIGGMDSGGRIMAAMRARRPTRGGGNENGGGPYRPRAPPPKPPAPVARLAAIKLDGIGPSDVGVTKKNMATIAVGSLLFLGAAIAGATWIGGSLFDAGKAFERSADQLAAGVGFRIEDIQIAGVSGARADEI